MNILIVDDNIDAADGLAMLVRGWGFGVEVRYSAVEGILAAQQLSPAVILHDIAMPEMDGYDAVARLRSQPQFRQTLIIAITADGDDKTRSRAKAVGFDEFFTKPANFRRLRQVLSRWEANTAPSQ